MTSSQGPSREMGWIYVDEELYKYSGQLTTQAETALYGRVTYEMMERYWPAAADQPGARHMTEIIHGGDENRPVKVKPNQKRTGKGHIF